MTQQELKELGAALSALGVFRRVLRDPALETLRRFLLGEDAASGRVALYGEFVYPLREDDYCLDRRLRRLVFADENRYVTAAAQGRELPAVVRENALAELALFSRLSRLTPEDLRAGLSGSGYLPGFESRPVDFAAEYQSRLTEIHRYGYGIFASAGMFRVAGDEIVPVSSPDVIRQDRFIGYEDQRRQVFDNTLALIQGRPAANVLLFGDAGTGKSSTVKACANYFYDQGVRLIELRKDQLFSLSAVMGRIADNPLKFILFIDDLSFNKNDDCFSMLKAALEGSASAKAPNAVIYATSNRRHIVKESFSDRAGSDDVHHSDTVQELMSLSDRFGLTVYFERPGKALYLQIVHELCARRGLTPDGDLDARAEAFALAKGSRSPRAAEQFVDSLR